jgi:hypothetical protein
MSARLSSIEGHLATMHGDPARHRGEIETIKSRLDRIESRLDLADAPHMSVPPEEKVPDMTPFSPGDTRQSQPS